jgi:transcriptional regulator with XRE-family HTH domain
MDTVEPPDDPVDVAQRLQELRAGRKLSIRALARLSGLAVNTLSLIENGKTSPSVSTLQRLAQALEVPIAEFFTRVKAQKRLVYTPAGERLPRARGKALIADMSAGLFEGAVQVMEISAEAGAASGGQPISHGGHEIIYGLSGSAVYRVEDQEYPIGPGDSLVFAADLAHSWRGSAADAVRFLLVLIPAEECDLLVSDHWGVEES